MLLENFFPKFLFPVHIRDRQFRTGRIYTFAFKTHFSLRSGNRLLTVNRKAGGWEVERGVPAKKN